MDSDPHSRLPGVNELWLELSEALRASGPYTRLRDELGATQGLPLPAAAWVADLLAEDLGRRLLVVLPHESDGLAWLDKLTSRRDAGGLAASPPQPRRLGWHIGHAASLDLDFLASSWSHSPVLSS